MDLAGGGGISPTPSPIIETITVSRQNAGDTGGKSYSFPVDLTNVSTVTIAGEVSAYLGAFQDGKKYYYSCARTRFGITLLPNVTSFVKAQTVDLAQYGYDVKTYYASGNYVIDVSDLTGEYYITIRGELINLYNNTYTNTPGNITSKINGVTFTK